jgi:hypothetical protein
MLPHRPGPVEMVFARIDYCNPRSVRPPAGATARRRSQCRDSFDRPAGIRYHAVAGWSSLVARRAHNPEVVGSNPTPATTLSPCSAPQIMIPSG